MQIPKKLREKTTELAILKEQGSIEALIKRIKAMEYVKAVGDFDHFRRPTYMKLFTADRCNPGPIAIVLYVDGEYDIVTNVSMSSKTSTLDAFIDKTEYVKNAVHFFLQNKESYLTELQDLDRKASEYRVKRLELLEEIEKLRKDFLDKHRDTLVKYAVNISEKLRLEVSDTLIYQILCSVDRDLTENDIISILEKHLTSIVSERDLATFKNAPDAYLLYSRFKCATTKSINLTHGDTGLIRVDRPYSLGVLEIADLGIEGFKEARKMATKRPTIKVTFTTQSDRDSFKSDIQRILKVKDAFRNTTTDDFPFKLMSK